MYEINYKRLRDENPHLKDVLFDGYSYFHGLEVVQYSKEFPTTLEFLRKHYKDDPDGLRMVLYHGLTHSKIRRNLRGEYSQKEVDEANIRYGGLLNIWVHL